MKDSLIRKVAIAILSMDLPEDKLKELEELLMDRSRVRDLLNACREMRRVLRFEPDEARSGHEDWGPAEAVNADMLLNVVAARRNFTTRQLSELVELVSGRKFPAGRLSKAEYVRKLGRSLTSDEFYRVIQMIKESPRSEGSKGRDEWFHQMSRRIRGER